MRGREKEGKADRGREGKAISSKLEKYGKGSANGKEKTPTYNQRRKETSGTIRSRGERKGGCGGRQKKQKIGNSRRQDQGTRMNGERLLISARERGIKERLIGIAEKRKQIELQRERESVCRGQKNSKNYVRKN